MSKTIVVVEDNPLILKIVSKLLISSGYKTITYNCCNELYHHLDLNSVDLIIIDNQLPDGSGEDIINFLKEQAKKQIKKVILTAYDLENDQLQYEVNAVIKKPWGNKDFIAEIQHILDN